MTTRRGVAERELAAHALRLAAGRPGAAVEVRDWPALLDLALVERLAPLAWLRSGAAIAAAADARVVARWRSAWLAATARAHGSVALLGEFVAALAGAGGRAVVLKGAPLAQRLYGDPGARPGADVDCYVAAEERPAARRIALSLGWTHAFGAAPDDEGFVRRTPHGQLFLELHSSLLGERLSFLPLPAPRGAAMSLAGVPLLAHDDALLCGYLAAHLATHSFPPLLWWLDLSELWAALDQPGRAAAEAAARGAGLHRYLRWALHRVAAVRRAVEGDTAALRAVGYGRSGRSDVHQLWRHATLAPDVRSAGAAVRAWVRPPWAAAQDGGAVAGTARRVARHWRALLPRARPRVATAGAGVPASSAAPVFAERVAAAPPEELLQVARAATAAGGELWLVVTGLSMTPTIADGDRVLLSRCPSPPRPGTVVLADAGPGRAVLHRVARVAHGEILTRGDACLTTDPPLGVESVVARAVAVRRGDEIAALVPTLRFGVGPFARYCWRTLRRRAAGLGAAARRSAAWSADATTGHGR